MKLEQHQLIQALIALKWISKEAIPLLSARMYESEPSVVGKLRAHGLTSAAIFEAAVQANSMLENSLPSVNLAEVKAIGEFDCSTFATTQEMQAQFVVPMMIVGGRLKVATADPVNQQFFDTLSLRSPYPIDFWVADSDEILNKINQIVAKEASDSQLSQPAATFESARAASVSQSSPALQSAANIAVNNDPEAERAIAQLSQSEHIEPRFVEDMPDIDNIHLQGAQESVANAMVTENITHDVVDARTQELKDSQLSDEALVDSMQAADSLDEESDSAGDDNGFIDDSTNGFSVNGLSINSSGSGLESMTTSTEVAPSAIVEAPLQEHATTSLPVDLPKDDDIIEYINYILLDAVTQKASDIHFEPFQSSYRIRFRVDGILRKVYVVPENYRQTLAARLKVMADLDIAEKRLPQDGHITICIENDEIDARISVIPTIWGEKVVLRLLDNSEKTMTLNKLGLTIVHKSLLQTTIERSQGLVLVTGPTGSGKTVTLYACLNHLNNASRNIATVEDPVEINIDGINQLQVHPKIGLDFAEALRAFLRQDPDVLMVGEIRDYETADITVKAAQTGHLVLSTLHTNSAAESLIRLQNMGIEPYNIASTVKLIIAQRLVRELCHCKDEDIVDSDYLESLGFTPMQAASRFYRASGCSECQDGYKGRFAIFEVLPISKRMSQLILENASNSEINAQIEREGIKNLRQAGIEAIMEGRTSLEEVLRVTTE